jgi:hypothetical protein
MHMGVLLYFLYDKSKNQERTRLLTDKSLDLAVRLISVGKLAVFRPVRKGLSNLLIESGLISA